MWRVVQRAISTLDEDFDAYATKHVDRLLANAAAAPLDDLLAAAGNRPSSALAREHRPRDDQALDVAGPLVASSSLASRNHFSTGYLRE